MRKRRATRSFVKVKKRRRPRVAPEPSTLALARLLLDHRDRTADVVERQLAGADHHHVVVEVAAVPGEAAVRGTLLGTGDEAHRNAHAAAAEAGEAAGLELHRRRLVADDAGPRGAGGKRAGEGDGRGEAERGREGRRADETHLKGPPWAVLKRPELNAGITMSLNCYFVKLTQTLLQDNPILSACCKFNTELGNALSSVSISGKKCRREHVYSDTEVYEFFCCGD